MVTYRMTTVQESPNGHHALPPPCSIENSPEPNRTDLPTNKANPIPNPSYVHIDTNQLFGDPAPGGNVVGRALDLPELYSACRDLTTAAGVNRALAQVFRLLAQRRISRQEAATFGHLAQLLLRTISAMRVLAGENPAANVYLSAGESHGHQELSPVHKAELRGVDKDHQELSPDNQV